MGKMNIKAIIENNNPLEVPIAKENQNESSLLFIKNGTKPNTVDSMVKKTGMIL